jgi:hypothetical protein
MTQNLDFAKRKPRKFVGYYKRRLHCGAEYGERHTREGGYLKQKVKELCHWQSNRDCRKY